MPLTVKLTVKSLPKLKDITSAFSLYSRLVPLSCTGHTSEKRNMSTCSPVELRSRLTCRIAAEEELRLSQPPVLWPERGPGQLAAGGRHVLTDVAPYSWLIPPAAQP